VLFVGDAYKRLGSRRVVLVARRALTLGVTGLTLAREPWHLFAAFAVMSVGWAATSGAALNVIVAPWFERRRGLAISLAFNGATGGGVVGGTAAALPDRAARVRGRRPRDRRRDAGGAAAARRRLAPSRPGRPRPRSRPAIRRRRPEPRPPARATRARSSAARTSGRSPCRSRSALLAQVGIITHQIAYLGPLLGAVGAGLAVSVTTAAGVMGRLALGGVVDRLDRRAVTAAVLLVQILGVAVLLAAPSRAALYAAVRALRAGRRQSHDAARPHRAARVPAGSASRAR